MTLRIANAIDMHCHFWPDTAGGTLEQGPAFPGIGPPSVTGIEAAREAQESGHAALVLKSHSFASPVLAQCIDDLVPGLRVFGGVCTDFPSGGLNVHAVEAALCLGAKIVWLPTLHSRQDVMRRPAEYRPPGIGDGIALFDDGGDLVPEVHEIFELVRQKDAILATGHTSADEHFAVAKEFGQRGKVVVTHAGERLAGPGLDAAQCAQLADLGATIEITAQGCKELLGHPGRTPAQVATMLRAIGTSRCVLSTDYGWTTSLPRPAAGMQEFLEGLWAEGVPETELETMVSANPARLLGLDL
jgi:hypothetical protein